MSVASDNRLAELAAKAAGGVNLPVAIADGQKVHDWASVANGANANTTVPVPGAVLGNFAIASMSVAVPAGARLDAAVTAPDVVTVTLSNNTGGALDLASGTLKARVLK